MAPNKLERIAFTQSRESEYFDESELTRQTGHPKDSWSPGVVVKELVDNGLDACEQAGVSPLIQIRIADDFLEVSDNGHGIAPDVVGRVVDYSTRTSEKHAVVSPLRGAQGNALKTIIAILYVLSGNKEARVEISARGVKHLISVVMDSIARRPQIMHETCEIVKTAGTNIRLTSFSPCSKGTDHGLQILQKLILDYSLFNPHATFIVNSQKFEATDPDFRKWLPTDPTSPHWYDRERFELLVCAYLAAERNGTKRTVREFVSEFRGLSATAKQSNVCEASGLTRAYLHDLAPNGRIDEKTLERLLVAMQKESKPVKPEVLGILGEEHFRRSIAADPKTSGKTFRYSRQKGFDSRGLPYLVECAFALVDGKSRLRGLHMGLNWGVPLGQPLQQTEFSIGKEGVVEGLTAALAKNRIDIRRDPLCLAIHMSCPRFNFLDRGKGSIAL
jgi:DNA topoisomerase VI subunit B